MSKSNKQILTFTIPVALAIFIFSQTIYPFLVGKKNSHVTKSRKVASTSETTKVKSKTLKKVEEVIDLKKVPDGQYYTYKANYSCINSQTARAIPSYVDSFIVSNGTLCRTGDLCGNGSKECFVSIPNKAQMARDFSVLDFEKNKYLKQRTMIPDSCIMPACAEPADICEFAEMPPLDSKGCPLGCGTIKCKPEGTNCPVLNCAAPPQNCEYDGRAPVDQNNCPTGCGNLVCDSISRKEFKCPEIKCATLPENCRYDSSAKLDKNGCKTTCGQLVCSRASQVTCPAPPPCAVPPAGCNYAGDPATDENGCVVGCGSMACHSTRPDSCKAPQCDPPSEFCRYDGNSPLDFNGCMTGCGNLICNNPK